MGRLIPAGTGMEFYRNVKVDRDPTIDQTREEQAVESLSEILGGDDLTPTIPAPRPTPVAADGDGAADEEADEGDEE